ncbi:MAG: iron ABC transporter permease [Anaerolineae bacterium]|nr:iron ABC transporter permease [Anaerolineae bacterium]
MNITQLMHSRARIVPSLPTASFSVKAGFWRWQRLLPLLLVLALLLPLGVLLLYALQFDLERWTHMWNTFLPRALGNTLTLIVGVGVGTGLLGTGFAWLLTAYEFPGRAWFDRLMLLPLAIPGFIMGFVYVTIFEYAGPVQTALRGWFGWQRGDYWFPNIASPAGLILVLTLVLFPYVYMLARTAFREQLASSIEAARVMGYNRLHTFFRLVLPLAYPQIAAGIILAMLEAMTDYGTVSYFSYPTLSERIVVLWNTEFDPGTATQLALLMMVVALCLITLARRVRGHARFYQHGGQGRHMSRQALRGWARTGAVLACLTLFGASFVLPVSQLLLWAVGELQKPTVGILGESIITYSTNSVVLAGISALIVVFLSLLIVYGLRATAVHRNRGNRRLARMVTLGYAMPGAVVAAGVLVVVNPIDAAVTDFATAFLGWVSPAYLLTGTVIALIYAYVVRFMAVGFNSTDASLEKISPSMEGAARTMGAGTWRILRQIHAPLVSTGLATGVILVFVDVMKELPATLLLRPFGMDTLALRTYFLSVEGWHRSAAIPALMILIIGLIPVFILMRVGDNPIGKHRHTPE